MKETLIKNAFLLITLLVLSNIGCVGGIDTVHITTDPAYANLYYTEPTHIFFTTTTSVRYYAGKTPISISIPWFMILPFAGGVPIQNAFRVIIKKFGYETITKRIGGNSFAFNNPNFVSVSEGSKFGWGKTYVYHFRLQSLVEVEKARQNELLDMHEVAKILRARGLMVSTMTIYQLMKDGRFPKPTTPPRDDRGFYGAQWRRIDIESWKPEAQESGD